MDVNDLKRYNNGSTLDGKIDYDYFTCKLEDHPVYKTKWHYNEIQIEIFKTWINYYIKAKNVKIDNFALDLKSGHILIILIEVLSGYTLVPLLNLRSEDIVDGNLKLTLGLVWQIIAYFKVKNCCITNTNLNYQGKFTCLFKWCYYSLEPFKNVDIQNLTNSWWSGIAFIMLLYRHRYDKFTIDDLLLEETDSSRLKCVFEWIQRNENINISFKSEDIKKWDENTMATFISLIREKFKLPKPILQMDSYKKNTSSKESVIGKFYNIIDILLIYLSDAKYFDKLNQIYQNPNLYEVKDVYVTKSFLFLESTIDLYNYDNKNIKDSSIQFKSINELCQNLHHLNTKMTTHDYYKDVSNEYLLLKSKIIKCCNILNENYPIYDKLYTVYHKIDNIMTSIENVYCEKLYPNFHYFDKINESLQNINKYKITENVLVDGFFNVQYYLKKLEEFEFNTTDKSIEGLKIYSQRLNYFKCFHDFLKIFVKIRNNFFNISTRLIEQNWENFVDATHVLNTFTAFRNTCNEFENEYINYRELFKVGQEMLKKFPIKHEIIMLEKEFSQIENILKYFKENQSNDIEISNKKNNEKLEFSKELLSDLMKTANLSLENLEFIPYITEYATKLNEYPLARFQKSDSIFNEIFRYNLPAIIFPRLFFKTASEKIVQYRLKYTKMKHAVMKRESEFHKTDSIYSIINTIEFNVYLKQNYKDLSRLLKELDYSIKNTDENFNKKVYNSKETEKYIKCINKCIYLVSRLDKHVYQLKLEKKETGLFNTRVIKHCKNKLKISNYKEKKVYIENFFINEKFDIKLNQVEKYYKIQFDFLRENTGIVPNINIESIDPKTCIDYKHNDELAYQEYDLRTNLYQKLNALKNMDEFQNDFCLNVINKGKINALITLLDKNLQHPNIAVKNTDYISESYNVTCYMDNDFGRFKSLKNTANTQELNKINSYSNLKESLNTFNTNQKLTDQNADKGLSKQIGRQNQSDSSNLNNFDKKKSHSNVNLNELDFNNSNIKNFCPDYFDDETYKMKHCVNFMENRSIHKFIENSKNSNSGQETQFDNGDSEASITFVNKTKSRNVYKDNDKKDEDPGNNTSFSGNSSLRHFKNGNNIYKNNRSERSDSKHVSFEDEVDKNDSNNDTLTCSGESNLVSNKNNAQSSFQNRNDEYIRKQNTDIYRNEKMNNFYNKKNEISNNFTFYNAKSKIIGIPYDYSIDQNKKQFTSLESDELKSQNDILQHMPTNHMFVPKDKHGHNVIISHFLASGDNYRQNEVLEHIQASNFPVTKGAIMKDNDILHLFHCENFSDQNSTRNISSTITNVVSGGDKFEKSNVNISLNVNRFNDEPSMPNYAHGKIKEIETHKKSQILNNIPLMEASRVENENYLQRSLTLKDIKNRYSFFSNYDSYKENISFSSQPNIIKSEPTDFCYKEDTPVMDNPKNGTLNTYSNSIKRYDDNINVFNRSFEINNDYSNNKYPKILAEYPHIKSVNVPFSEEIHHAYDTNDMRLENTKKKSKIESRCPPSVVQDYDFTNETSKEAMYLTGPGNIQCNKLENYPQTLLRSITCNENSKSCDMFQLKTEKRKFDSYDSLDEKYSNTLFNKMNEKCKKYSSDTTLNSNSNRTKRKQDLQDIKNKYKMFLFNSEESNDEQNVIKVNNFNDDSALNKSNSFINCFYLSNDVNNVNLDVCENFKFNMINKSKNEVYVGLQINANNNDKQKEINVEKDLEMKKVLLDDKDVQFYNTERINQINSKPNFHIKIQPIHEYSDNTTNDATSTSSYMYNFKNSPKTSISERDNTEMSLKNICNIRKQRATSVNHKPYCKYDDELKLGNQQRNSDSETIKIRTNVKCRLISLEDTPNITDKYINESIKSLNIHQSNHLLNERFDNSRIYSELPTSDEKIILDNEQNETVHQKEVNIIDDYTNKIKKHFTSKSKKCDIKKVSNLPENSFIDLETNSDTSFEDKESLLNNEHMKKQYPITNYLDIFNKKMDMLNNNINKKTCTLKNTKNQKPISNLILNYNRFNQKSKITHKESNDSSIHIKKKMKISFKNKTKKINYANISNVLNVTLNKDSDKLNSSKQFKAKQTLKPKLNGKNRIDNIGIKSDKKFYTLEKKYTRKRSNSVNSQIVEKPKYGLNEKYNKNQCKTIFNKKKLYGSHNLTYHKNYVEKSIRLNCNLINKIKHEPKKNKTNQIVKTSKNESEIKNLLSCTGRNYKIANINNNNLYNMNNLNMSPSINDLNQRQLITITAQKSNINKNKIRPIKTITVICYDSLKITGESFLNYKLIEPIKPNLLFDKILKKFPMYALDYEINLQNNDIDSHLSQTLNRTIIVNPFKLNFTTMQPILSRADIEYAHKNKISNKDALFNLGSKKIKQHIYFSNIAFNLKTKISIYFNQNNINKILLKTFKLNEKLIGMQNKLQCCKLNTIKWKHQFNNIEILSKDSKLIIQEYKDIKKYYTENCYNLDKMCQIKFKKLMISIENTLRNFFQNLKDKEKKLKLIKLNNQIHSGDWSNVVINKKVIAVLNKNKNNDAILEAIRCKIKDYDSKIVEIDQFVSKNVLTLKNLKFSFETKLQNFDKRNFANYFLKMDEKLRNYQQIVKSVYEYKLAYERLSKNKKVSYMQNLNHFFKKFHSFISNYLIFFSKYQKHINIDKTFNVVKWKWNFLQWCENNDFDIHDIFHSRAHSRLTRREFIEAIIDTKFPSTRYELNKLANNFHLDDILTFMNCKKFTNFLNKDTDTDFTPKLNCSICNKNFYIESLSNDRYTIKKFNNVQFIKILKSGIMVRVGGGWEDILHYLNRTDPCRIKDSARYELDKSNLPEFRNSITDSDTSTIISSVSGDSKSTVNSLDKIIKVKNCRLNYKNKNRIILINYNKEIRDTIAMKHLIGN
ncbi:hypothetical protein A3Q56_00458 [Intoshia linei]|uniref:GAR domain-containing protein n=1 Tax=Intoshia linei TaxID=1819745 RepID=A0A177BBS5_9BILA|nr:hypothetical protein A3Q56_00458 [Intoshia linei]